jgi:hypothetical protein
VKFVHRIDSNEILFRMSQRSRRQIRFEEYASTGKVTEFVQCSLQPNEKSKPCVPSRFAAANSHIDNEAYLAAFDNDPRSPEPVKAISKPVMEVTMDDSVLSRKNDDVPLLISSTANLNLSKSSSNHRHSWLQGPLDSAGRAENVSSQPLTCMSLSPDKNEIVVGSCDHALYGISLTHTAKGKKATPVRHRTYFTKTCGHREWVTAVAHLGG